MISITTNLQSMMVRSNLRNATNDINATIKRMTTGFKLNRAKDNAAGVYIANSMVSKLSSFQVAYDNADIGLSYLSTAEGNLDLVSSHLQRVKALIKKMSRSPVILKKLKIKPLGRGVDFSFIQNLSI